MVVILRQFLFYLFYFSQYILVFAGIFPLNCESGSDTAAASIFITWYILIYDTIKLTRDTGNHVPLTHSRSSKCYRDLNKFLLCGLVETEKQSGIGDVTNQRLFQLLFIRLLALHWLLIAWFLILSRDVKTSVFFFPYISMLLT